MKVLVAGVLVWAAVFKFRGGTQRSALSRLVGKEHVVAVFRVIGVVELVLAAALFTRVGEWVTFAWFLGMLGYLSWARVAEPESSCGCLSEKYAPVGARALARAVLLAGMVVTADLLPWYSVFPAAVLVFVLSAELDDYWLLGLRRLKVRLRHPLAGGEFVVPVASTVQQLHKSQTYQSVYPILRSDLLDTWDEGDWRILTYSAERDGERATAVFAVPRNRYEPEAVRFALA
ncbi:MauE/DoxX family redox-associated membrane protein [Kibdelosporangium banguiense]